jgi:ABC-2 type transport system ATP-binding protein
VSLEVPKGGVFGLMGKNGAGKTTLIKHILGLYRPAEGTVRVLGRSPSAEPVEALKRLGYLSEFLDLPLWMRVDELLRYSRAFYATWDPDYAEALRRQLDLDPAARLKNLSKGQQAKAGLLVALAFRPDLLVLDEPSSGLDPVARRDILETILRAAGEEGRTVFFSSHLLDEVERIANRVAMIHEGRIVFSGSLADIQKSHSHWRVRLVAPNSPPPAWEGVLQASGAGQDWELSCQGQPEALAAAFARTGATVLERRSMRLDEVFLARVAPNGR